MASPTQSAATASSANFKHFSSLIRQLAELRTEVGVDDYGALRADKRAYDTACALLTDAAEIANRIGGLIPHGCASTDSAGGIRIEWVRPASGVHLVVPAPPDDNPYIYHEVGDDYATEPASAEGLARWLQTVE